MSFPIRIAPLVRFKVEGSFTGEQGEPLPFEFFMTCERLRDQPAIDALNKVITESAVKGSTTAITDAIASKVRGWEMKDEAGQDVAFTQETLIEVLNRTNVAQLVYGLLCRESGAKAKNS